MGQPLTPAYTRQVAAIAHAHGVPLHIDGARFWNAVVAQGVDGRRDLADPADTVTFCLSKGLGLPGRLASSSARGTSSGGRAGPASWSAAGCARPGSSRRPGSSPCRTARTA